MQRRSLGTRLSALSMGLILLTATSVMGLFLWRDIAESERHLAQTGIELGSLVASNAEFGLYTRNSEVLLPLVRSLRANEDVVAVEIQDGAGIVLAALDPSQIGEHRETAGGIRKPATLGTDVGIQVLVPVVASRDQLFEPIDSDGPSDGPKEDLLGFVRIELGRERLHASIVQRIQIALLALLAVVFAGGAITIYLTRRITVPIHHLAAVAGEIADGQFDKQVEVDSQDEIQDLAESFNRMVGQLRLRDEKIGRHRQELERTVAERTVELRKTIEDLDLARVAAEAASRAKSEFLATMSHEIRTPMNGVLGMADLIQRTALDEKQARYAARIQQSGEFLLHILNNILDYSKIEAGRMELESIEFVPRDLIEEIAQMFAVQAQAKALELVCSPSTLLPSRVRGDRSRMIQVLSNLVSNAIKFTPKGEVLVRAVPARSEGGTVWVRFEVQDTGIGIQDAHRGRIFESFTQADSSTTREYGGTGLGLAICNRLTDLMGGSIELDSSPGQWTRFSVTVPLELVDSLAAPAAPDSHSLGRLEGARVLVVDDNATNREVLFEWLSAWGVTVWEAEDGSDAVRSIELAQQEDRPFDAIVLDMDMPRLDGLGVLRTVNDPALSARTIILSSVDGIGYNKALREMGVASCSTKPVRQEEFSRSLALAIKRPIRDQDRDPAGDRDRDRDGGRDLDRARPALAPSATPQLPRSRNPLRILLAEDTPVNSELVVEMLSDSDVEVRLAANGSLAVDEFRNGSFDLVLMDCQMPGMDGFEATRRIRELEKELGRIRTPVLAMTANALSGDRGRCLEAGMDDYLAKPFGLDELLALITRWAPAGSSEGQRDRRCA